MVRWLVGVVLLMAACSANDDTPSPQLSDVQPNPAPAGTVVTLTGDHFCSAPPTTPGDDGNDICPTPGEVDFGAAPGTPTTWSNTSIQVQVPSGVTGEVSLSVIAGGRPSNAISFTVN